MRIDLPDSMRSVLRRAPVYTPALIGLEGSEELALAMRVENLAPFRRADLLITVRLVVWCSDQGTWVVVIAFRVVDDPRNPCEGDAYLNPRQAADHTLLHRLARQERFPLLFLSKDLLEAVGKQVSWSPQQRGEVAAVLASVERSLTGSLGAGKWDPDFERAKVEFQRRYTVADLLA